MQIFPRSVLNEGSCCQILKNKSYIPYGRKNKPLQNINLLSNINGTRSKNAAKCQRKAGRGKNVKKLYAAVYSYGPTVYNKFPYSTHWGKSNFRHQFQAYAKNIKL